jgi:hypothetical protein
MTCSSPANDKNEDGQDDQGDQQRQPGDLAVGASSGLVQGIAVCDFVLVMNQLRLGASDLAEHVLVDAIEKPLHYSI